MNNNRYAILMAGGVGSRFWPMSTPEYPKQFHDLVGCGRSMLQKSFDRLEKFIPKSNIFILTNQAYKALIEEQLPDIAPHQAIYEPALRNTAPCILYASLKIKQLNPKATILVSPSDSWIEDEKAYENDLSKCLAYCEENAEILTVGINPTFPATGYGYIKYAIADKNDIKKVETFTEKPEEQLAVEYFEQRGYLWNAGIFVWNVSTIIDAYKEYQPKMYNLLEYDSYNSENELLFIEKNYPKTENISVDYAILERANNIGVYPSSFDWNDLGTWRSLHEKLPKDNQQNATVNVQSLLKNTKNSIVLSKNKKNVVIDGLDDYIIVDTEDTLLIFPKSKDQDIKSISKEAKRLISLK